MTNHSKKYVELMIKLYTGNSDDAVETWKKFLAQAETFDRVNWTKSKQLAERFHTKQKECFSNCAKIVCAMPELTFVEGIACHTILTAHAWLVNDDGDAFDPTYALVEEHEKTDYFGMRIPLHVLIQTAANSYEPRWLKVLKN